LKKSFRYLVPLGLLFLLASPASAGRETAEGWACYAPYISRSGNCLPGCGHLSYVENGQTVCTDCENITSLDRCRSMSRCGVKTTCDGAQVCTDYWRVEMTCGGHAGYAERCGREDPHGQCENIGALHTYFIFDQKKFEKDWPVWGDSEHWKYWIPRPGFEQEAHQNFPVCIPCGNGTCDRNENRCNCPEDCAVKEQEADEINQPGPADQTLEKTAVPEKAKAKPVPKKKKRYVH